MKILQWKQKIYTYFGSRTKAWNEKGKEKTKKSSSRENGHKAICSA